MKKIILIFGLLFITKGIGDNYNEWKINEVNMKGSKLEEVEFRFIKTNGIKMRLAEIKSDGPVVLFAHGWPESWYSWRHQLKALAEVGFHVIAPDMRGYGETEAPDGISKYDIKQLESGL